MIAIQPRFNVGQQVIYTGKAGSMPGEFRGYYSNAFGEKVARIIVRPESGPPFETEAELNQIRA